MPLPLMARVRQQFERPLVQDIELEVRSQLAALHLETTLKPGESVAITVGSRGVANIPLITKAVVDHVRGLGGVPFIVPAMGSHGGATAEGQVGLLKSLGVTEQTVGAEIRSSMETVVVATTSFGLPVHFDRHAFGADHVIVMGRIKPHTMFVGEIESGLHKMMLIGLGKHTGAQLYHRAINNWSFEQIIHAVAEVVLKQCRILAGVAIVENAYDETALIQAVRPEEFAAKEKELLRKAVLWLPRLPFPVADLLIVDQIGKNISGSGMDTNVVGRKFNDHAATAQDQVSCKRILVRSLTPESKGNALGLGIAEFTTARAVAQIDREYTRVNCITSCHPTAGMTPLTYPDDRSAVTEALETIGWTQPYDARVMQITDTLHLSELLVSEAYFRGEDDVSDLEILSPPLPMEFDEAGTLADVAVA